MGEVRVGELVGEGVSFFSRSRESKSNSGGCFFSLEFEVFTSSPILASFLQAKPPMPRPIPYSLPWYTLLMTKTSYSKIP